MPRRVVVAQKCSPSDALVVCAPRLIAESEGDFWWDVQLFGWCHKEILRTPHPDSWRRAYMGLPDTTGVPYRLELCPFCSVELPDLPGVQVTITKQEQRNQCDGMSDGPE